MIIIHSADKYKYNLSVNINNINLSNFLDINLSVFFDKNKLSARVILSVGPIKFGILIDDGKVSFINCIGKLIEKFFGNKFDKILNPKLLKSMEKWILIIYNFSHKNKIIDMLGNNVKISFRISEGQVLGSNPMFKISSNNNSIGIDSFGAPYFNDESLWNIFIRLLKTVFSVEVDNVDAHLMRDGKKVAIILRLIRKGMPDQNISISITPGEDNTISEFILIHEHNNKIKKILGTLVKNENQIV